jgi:peptide chain release factor 1
MLEKLTQLETTHDELTHKLADPEVISDRKAFVEASKALAEIDHLVELYREYKEIRRQQAETEEMLAGLNRDDELREMARDELAELTTRREDLEEKLRVELVPSDPNDQRNDVHRIGGNSPHTTLRVVRLFSGV